MGAIKLTGIAKDGKLTVMVPSEFNDKRLDVIIKTSEDDFTKKELAQEKINKLMSIVGSAKFPDFPITKYDVYDQ